MKNMRFVLFTNIRSEGKNWIEMETEMSMKCKYSLEVVLPESGITADLDGFTLRL